MLKLSSLLFSSTLALSAVAAETSHTKPFITGGLLGQLGNQMFEIAATCSLAWDNDADCYFPDFAPVAHYPDSYHRHVFYRLPIQPPSAEVSTEFGVPCFGHHPITFTPGMRLSGYLQNEKYFAHHRQRIIDLFAPSEAILTHLNGKYADIINHPESVSVHLRYYYAEKPNEDSFVQYNREYYERAMAHFPSASLFVVFSDNIPYAKQNIPTEGRNVVFIENEPYYMDFYLQSMCKHHIISNSTFSWWSAWLNQNPSKIVVRPEVWLGGHPDIGGPDEWIRVSARGMQEQMREEAKAGEL